MSVDMELDQWREEWQSDCAASPGLRREVERQSRHMKVAFIGNIAVTITIGGTVAAWAIRSRQSSVLLLALETWIAIAAAWAFALKANRGKWFPSAEDAAAFLDLSVGRCRARLAGVRFAALFFLVHTAFILVWTYKFSPEPRMPASKWLLSLPLDVVWLAAVAFYGFLLWHRRRKLAELNWFLELREQMLERNSL